ncbi:MAG: hypothetical protein RBS80_28790 [Thermoguttaceae bacterium]|jgi:hypothetical protein|nr:hypothetical protein [Thermoguttaceae bacterium]
MYPSRKLPVGSRVWILCGTACTLGLSVAPTPYVAGQDVWKRADAVQVTAGFGAYIEQSPWLLEGGRDLVVSGDDWVAIGVGGALLVDQQNDPISPAQAQRVARVNANSELAKALHGAILSAKDQTDLTTGAGAGGSQLREFFRSASKEQVAVVLRRVEVVGTWRVKDTPLICVMVAVGNVGNPLFLSKMGDGVGTVRFRNAKVEEPWRGILRTRPGILTGGATLCRHDNRAYLVVVGRARVTGDPVADYRWDEVASGNAFREAQQFLKGLTILSTTQVTLEYLRLTEGERTIVDSIRGELETITEERVLGNPGGRRPVGHWESSDGQFYYAAFVMELSDVK